MAEKTIGETRVRADFNVTGSDAVTRIKNKSAELIDMCQEMKDFPATKDHPAGIAPPEKLRLISLAQTAFEEASMWAVKAATA